MTALRQYQRLESSGLWRQSEASQRREVFISFGNTSLVIHDKHEAPLSHWSLPAIQRLNPGETPALFSPNPDAGETLEIDDKIMVDAIEKVRAAINRRRPHPGRLRLGILALVSLSIIALIAFWLPGALLRQTIKVVPFETRNQIGQQVLAQITLLTGPPCTTPDGTRALGMLARRLSLDPRGRILVLPGGIAKSAMLPGKIVLLNKRLIEDYQQPAVAASYVMLEQLRARRNDPLARVLRYAGALASFRLLTTGQLAPATIAAYARKILVTTNPLPADAILLAGFKKAGFASSPLAYALDKSGETTLPLIEGDPFRNRAYKPLLSDDDWIGLEGICSN